MPAVRLQRLLQVPVGSSVHLGDEEAVDGAVRILGRVEDDLGVGPDTYLDLGILVVASPGRGERFRVSR